MSYPSDVSDAEWNEIQDFFKPDHPGRPRLYEMRALYNAIRYVQRAGCQWRMLPKDFPPWPTVYMTFYRQRQKGVRVASHQHRLGAKGPRTGGQSPRAERGHC